MLGLIQAPCTEEKRAKCKQLHSDPAHLAWTCEKCKSVRPEEVSPYTNHLLYLHRLKSGGYPFGPDDLDLDTWADLGLVTELLNQATEQGQWAAILKLLTSR